MSTLEALEADLAALRAEGSLKANTTAIQEGMRRLAITLDSRETEARDKAACLKGLREAMADIVTETSGVAYAEWLERVGTI